MPGLSGCRGGFYVAGKGAVGQARDERVAGRDLRDGTDQAALCIEDQRVTAFEHGEGRKGMQAGVERAKSPGMGVEQVLDSAMEVVAASLEALAGLRKRLARVVAKHGGAESCNVALLKAKPAGDCILRASCQFVQALGTAIQQGGDAGFSAADGQAREALARL